MGLRSVSNCWDQYSGRYIHIWSVSPRYGRTVLGNILEKTVDPFFFLGLLYSVHSIYQIGGALLL